MKIQLLLCACLAATIGCTSAPSGNDVLFSGGRIYVGDTEWSAVEAVLVRDGKVVAVGDLGDLRSRAGPDCAAVDLRGGFAVPGLQDAHGHLEGHGAALESVDLVGTRSYDEVIERVAALAALQPPGTWIEGRGWDQNDWPDKVFPHHLRLSERVPDHPVFVRRIDGHAALANAAALRLADLEGAVADLPAIAGGAVLSDDSGRASGVFVDAAMALVARHVPEPDRATRRRRILRAQESLLAVGLTAVHDMGAAPSTIDILEDLRAEGRLRLRVVAYLAGLEALEAARAGRFPLAADSRDMLAVPGVKLYVDGALGSRGAALLEDYSDDAGNRGLLQVSPADLERAVATLAALGLQPAIHAIGDRANRIVLDVYEAVAAREPELRALRPRVEHAQIVAPDDWGRLLEGGFVPSVQPTHATSDMPWVPARLGAERLDRAYPWLHLDPQAEFLALGSDFPVESPDPLAGLYAARTRQDRAGRPPGGWLASQRLSAGQALAGFTSGAAFAAHQEDRRGSLLPGFHADMTVLDVDPLQADARDLLGARVLMTVVNGAVVFRADGPPTDGNPGGSAPSR